MELRKALAFSVFSEYIFMGDYRDFEAAALKTPEFYELNDQLHFLKMYDNILTLIYSLHSNPGMPDTK